jgi:hypothetical protein
MARLELGLQLDFEQSDYWVFIKRLKLSKENPKTVVPVLARYSDSQSTKKDVDDTH